MIDAHHHFWRVARGDYGWMDDSVAPIRRDYLPADLHPLATAAGITGTVLVQAAPTVAETLFMLSLADTDPLIRAVVGWADLGGDDDGAMLRRLAQHPRLRGVRPMLQDIDETDWILRPGVLRDLEIAADVGLSFDALITPRHLSAIDRLAAMMPQLPIVIDHCAKPRFDATGDPGNDWRDGMARLAAHPHVMCKLSGLANEYGPAWSAEALRPVFDHVLAIFGPERLMWGSDWPVLNLAGDYAGWAAAARQLIADLEPEAGAAITGGTARRFYRLEA